MNDTLQRLCRDYLGKLRDIAEKHGLGRWLADTITANARGECSATEQEVEFLSKMCDDERINRQDIPKLFGVSYRYCVDNELFEKLKKLPHVGIYSKVNAILFGVKRNYKSKDNGNE